MRDEGSTTIYRVLNKVPAFASAPSPRSRPANEPSLDAEFAERSERLLELRSQEVSSSSKGERRGRTRLN